MTEYSLFKLHFSGLCQIFSQKKQCSLDSGITNKEIIKVQFLLVTYTLLILQSPEIFFS